MCSYQINLITWSSLNKKRTKLHFSFVNCCIFCYKLLVFRLFPNQRFYVFWRNVMLFFVGHWINFTPFINLLVKRNFFFYIFTGYSCTFERVVIISNFIRLISLLLYGEIRVIILILIFLLFIVHNYSYTLNLGCM